jgi:predicted dehydrogenase
VLIEKPIATSAREAEELAAAARSAGVFAAEAMWTRYLPQFDVLAQLLQRGDLGTIRLAAADVGWAIGDDAASYLLDPALGGGAALDMGVYGYWFAQFAIGRPQQIRAVGSMTSTGVDEQSAVAITGPEGRHAAVTTTMAVTASGLAWQTTAIAGYIDQGRTDSAVHSLDDAIGVLRTIDAVRAQLQASGERHVPQP